MVLNRIIDPGASSSPADRIPPAMSEVDLENFEKRATAAEQQIETLTKRMEELERALCQNPAAAVGMHPKYCV